MFESILSFYNIDQSDYSVKSFGDGLINYTWKIISSGKEFLLQKINQKVFHNPIDIMENSSRLSDYFLRNHPGYLFVSPLVNNNKQNYVVDAEGNYYRLFPFVKDSYTCNAVLKTPLAYEAAKQFGKFTHLLSKFDPSSLRITVPDFHNLTLRQRQFESALQTGNKKRITESSETISFLASQTDLVETFEKIKHHPEFRLRVIHHDAKINNVLFDIGSDIGLCVIDLDTVMPGYYISDVGDMLRTYLSPVSEEESDFSRISIRDEFFQQIVKGYLEEMKSELSLFEIQYFLYAGKFAIYMQAIRFLTDYLNNDLYYSIKYPDHNLTRANNQSVLLKRFLEKEDSLKVMLKS
jgi:thiamine kinase-like enzyme